MTEIEINNRNEAILLFLGYTKKPCSYINIKYNSITNLNEVITVEDVDWIDSNNKYYQESMKFQEDWNELMPVFEKIQKSIINTWQDDWKLHNCSIDSKGIICIHYQWKYGKFGNYINRLQCYYTGILKHDIWMAVSDFCLDWVKMYKL